MYKLKLPYNRPVDLKNTFRSLQLEKDLMLASHCRSYNANGLWSRSFLYLLIHYRSHRLEHGFFTRLLVN